MKHKIFVWLVLCLLVVALPAVFAEETDDATEENVEIVSSMETKVGAEVRLLQLERAITKHILKMNTVIERVIEKGLDASELEAIVTEMEALKLEVQSLNPDDASAVETFVTIKKEAITLTQNFRTEVRELLSEEDRDALGQRIRELRSDDETLREKIREKVHEFNAHMVERKLQTLGVDDASLVAQVRSGDVDASTVRQRIAQKATELDPQERRIALERLKRASENSDVTARERIAKVRISEAERQEKRQEWVDRASDNIENEDKKLRVQQRIGARIARADGVEVRAQSNVVVGGNNE